MFKFFSRKPKAPQPTAPTPPPPAKSGTVALTFGEVMKLLPQLEKFAKKAVNQYDLGQVYDTLKNSAIMPPAPWLQHVCRFDHIITLPSSPGGYSMYFIFYPL